MTNDLVSTSLRVWNVLLSLLNPPSVPVFNVGRAGRFAQTAVGHYNVLKVLIDDHLAIDHPVGLAAGVRFT